MEKIKSTGKLPAYMFEPTLSLQIHLTNGVFMENIYMV